MRYSTCEPQIFEEAIKDDMKELYGWRNYYHPNRTWKLVELPQRIEIISLQWIYKTKNNEDGTIQKHKTQLVAKCYNNLELISMKALPELLA